MVREIKGGSHSRPALVRQIEGGLSAIEKEVARQRGAKVEPLITYEEVGSRLGFDKISSVKDLVYRRVIPCIRLGHRTVRFRWSEVEAAINQYRQGAIQ